MSNCVKCGKPAKEAESVISGGRYLYEDEGEWVCSNECLAAVEKERSDTDYFLGT